LARCSNTHVRHNQFLQHYHKRAKVESTFSMMKRKFGDSLRSKTDVAVNETLCKVLSHNLVVLIREMHELGIDPMFRGIGRRRMYSSYNYGQKKKEGQNH
jgi:hypothetical protein